MGFGDFGEEGAAQQDVSKAIAKYHRDKPFDFGALFGGQHRTRGVTGDRPTSAGNGWEVLDPRGIPFYATGQP